jgi:probable addiction module antidote protein
MRTGKTTPSAALSATYDAADYLRSREDIALFLEEVLGDGDPRAVCPAIRVVADAVGGVGALAAKTGLNRENLYRALSSSGNPRLDTLCAVLSAFGLRLSVVPTRVSKGKTRRIRSNSSNGVPTRGRVQAKRAR